MTAGPLWLSAAEQYRAVTVGSCADALRTSLLAQGEDPSAMRDPTRLALRVPGGELLVMPSVQTGAVGVKLVSVSQEGSPHVQGVHVQFDPDTLAPVAVLDGAALTNLRTSAVSLLALRALAEPESRNLLVFGAGPQARTHVSSIVAEWPVARVRVVSRRAETATRLVDELRIAMAATSPGVDVAAIPMAEVAAAVPWADIIVCATTSATPVFDAPLSQRAAVVAIGSHTPNARELPGKLLASALIAVDHRPAALREAGDIVMAVAEGSIAEHDIEADLSELARGGVLVDDRPRVFKSVGMAWQDAVVGAEVVRLSGPA